MRKLELMLEGLDLCSAADAIVGARPARLESLALRAQRWRPDHAQHWNAHWIDRLRGVLAIGGLCSLVICPPSGADIGLSLRAP